MVVMTVRVGGIGTATVGTGFRFEAGVRDTDRKAQPFEHIVQHMVMQVGNPAWLNLDLHVAVTQVITGAGKLVGISTGDNRNTLLCCPDLDDVSILGSQQVSLLECRAAFEHDTCILTIIQRDTQARLDTLLQRQGQATVYAGRTGYFFCQPDHVQNRK